MQRQSGYYATCFSLLWVGQRRGWSAGEQDLTVGGLSGCDEYSFNVGQVGDVDT